MNALKKIKRAKTIGINEVTGIGRTWVAHQVTINMPTPAVAQACSLILEGGADTIVKVNASSPRNSPIFLDINDLP